MATWRVAESLETLRRQLNEAFPKRSKASDGGIGDARHQASSSSDHNPHIKVGKMGVVTARDFTHDPKTGIDCQWLADCLVKNKDTRIKYIIWNKQICSSKSSPWKWRPYSGKNAHSHHLHLSVDSKLFDTPKAWKLDFPKATRSDVAKIIQVSSARTPATPRNVEPPQGEAPANVGAITEGEVVNVPLIPASEPAIQVAQISAAPDEPKPEVKEDPVVSIGNRVSAAWTAAGATVIAIGAWLTTTPIGIAVAIVASIALIGIGYMLINAVRNNAKEKRDHDAKLKREEKEAELKIQRDRQAFELQLVTLKAAADPKLNAVVISAPPPVEIANADTTPGA